MDAAAVNAAALSACPHITSCGGCADLRMAAGAAKHDLLPAALRAAGFVPPPPGPLAVSAPRTRRRMDLAARRGAGGIELGLHRHRSHEIVTLHACAVLHPALVALFAPLRDVLSRLDLLRRSGAVIANRLDTGIDLLLRTDAPPSRHDRTRLAAFAQDCGIARVAHALGAAAPETLVQLHRAEISLCDIVVAPPPGAFLQATAAGEAAIVAAVLAGLPRPLAGRARIAELHAGCGTLTFALARHARVDAFEGDAGALAALDAACRASGLIGRITPAFRDLARQPLLAAALRGYACVVLDPPAAGAPEQIAQIAASGVGRVVYVSCDPRSLARDASRLRQHGYGLLSATAVDQFIGTARVESVIVFARQALR